MLKTSTKEGSTNLVQNKGKSYYFILTQKYLGIEHGECFLGIEIATKMVFTISSAHSVLDKSR